MATQTTPLEAAETTVDGRRARYLGRWIVWASLALGTLLGGALGAAWLVPLPRRLEVADSPVVTWRDGGAAHVFLSADDKWRIAPRLEEIDPDYLHALVALEDRRFYGHPGVDPVAVMRASWTNLRAARVVSGASTISMQLARLLEPRPRRIASKWLEAARAVQLELRLGKRGVLVQYLRFLPFGRNVEGLEAASLAYFGHSASELGPAEISLLLAVPQSPTVRHPRVGQQGSLRAWRAGVASQLCARGALQKGGQPLDCARAEAELAQTPVPDAMRPFPRAMPHAAHWLRSHMPRDGRLKTTLDPSVQLMAEQVMERYRWEAERAGISHGAMVVVDHEASEVRGLVGNFDFGEAPGSQIAAFATARSSGSLLKPMLLGSAVDRGVALPGFLEADTPFVGGGYRPENYGGGHAGLVRLDEALAQSLNIPFVRLLQRLGVDWFVGQLGQYGFSGLRAQPGHYGLSLAVGGAEVTPLEVAGAYGTLARLGAYRPVRWLASAERLPSAMGDSQDARRAMSAEAAWLLLGPLGHRDRPDFPSARRAAGLQQKIYWKTGTSYGHRDAWAAGFGARHVVVVWMGNLDQRPARALVGGERSGPPMFDMLEALESGSLDATVARPAAMVRVEVCAFSGRLPSQACEHRQEVWAPRRSVPTERCPFHVRLDVDVASGLAVGPGCRDDFAHRRESFLRLPASVRRWMANRQTDVALAPAMHPQCLASAGAVGATTGERPVLVHPPAGQTIVLMPGIPASGQRVPLQAELASSQEELSWFVNGAFLGSLGADEPMWWEPAPGAHEIVVMAPGGASDRRVLEVRAGGPLAGAAFAR